jgi:hypothetical protein
VINILGYLIVGVRNMRIKKPGNPNARSPYKNKKRFHKSDRKNYK